MVRVPYGRVYRLWLLHYVVAVTSTGELLLDLGGHCDHRVDVVAARDEVEGRAACLDIGGEEVGDLGRGAEWRVALELFGDH